MNIVNISGFVGSVASAIALTPQIYKVYKTRSVKDMSLLMLFNYLLCAIAWIIYGLSISSNFIIFSNIMSFLCTSILITQKKLYDKDNLK
jgi:MtN3 and saliva related transmembrane protein